MVLKTNPKSKQPQTAIKKFLMWGLHTNYQIWAHIIGGVMIFISGLYVFKSILISLAVVIGIMILFEVLEYYILMGGDPLKDYASVEMWRYNTIGDISSPLIVILMIIVAILYPPL